MTSQWDRFENSAGRSLRNLGWNDNVDVYQATESFTQGEGYDVSYPTSADDTVSASVLPPSADERQTPGGTMTEADLVVYVQTETGVTWTTGGQSGRAKTRIKIDGLSGTFQVDSKEELYSGMIVLNCTEVDT